MATNIRRAFGDKEPLVGKTHRGKRTETHDYDRLTNLVRGLSDRMDVMQMTIDRLIADTKRLNEFASTVEGQFYGIRDDVATLSKDVAELGNAVGSMGARLTEAEKRKRSGSKGA